METKLDVFKLMLTVVMTMKMSHLINRTMLNEDQAESIVSDETAKWLARFDAAAPAPHASADGQA